MSIHIVIDGYDSGRKLAEYAMQKLVYELHIEAGLTVDTPDEQVRRLD
jgi:hypothetical protein